MDKKSKALFWVLFFASLGLAVAVYFYLPAFTSLTVVPIVTTLVKAMDLI